MAHPLGDGGDRLRLHADEAVPVQRLARIAARAAAAFEDHQLLRRRMREALDDAWGFAGAAGRAGAVAVMDDQHRHLDPAQAERRPPQRRRWAAAGAARRETAPAAAE